MTEIWIQTDEAADVAGSIRHALRTAQVVNKDAQSWKWVIIALHSALQGSCVCHLTTTAAPIGALTESNTRKWLTYLEDSRTNNTAKPPETKLMALPDLLKAVRKSNSAGDRSNASGVTITDSELSWLKRFHADFRNQFTHFEPKSWSIEVSGIPEIAKLIARIIEEIIECGWAFRHFPCSEREEMKRNLQALTTMEWLT